ncbi:MAG TPA: hypothetical protein VNZ03_36210 [Terriglobales bacterium]|nr:hypothetical protein [Terriglobales bacterium]
MTDERTTFVDLAPGVAVGFLMIMERAVGNPCAAFDWTWHPHRGIVKDNYRDFGD